MIKMTWSWFLLEITAIKLVYWLTVTEVFGLVFLISLINTSIKMSLVRGTFAAYVVLIVVSTTFNRSPSAETYNLVPFWSYRAYVRGHKDVISQVFLNLIMFVPYGFLGVEVVESYFEGKSKAFKRIITVLTAVILSIAIEVTQLITHKGLCETDDVIHNTLGALVGVGLWQLCGKIMHKHNTENTVSAMKD